MEEFLALKAEFADLKKKIEDQEDEREFTKKFLSNNLSQDELVAFIEEELAKSKYINNLREAVNLIAGKMTIDLNEIGRASCRERV